MFCKYCGKEIKEDVNYCKYCGAKLKDFETDTSEETEVKVQTNGDSQTDIDTTNIEQEEIQLNKNVDNSNIIISIVAFAAIVIVMLVIGYAINKGDNEPQNIGNTECKELSSKIESSMMSKNADINYSEVEEAINSFYDKNCSATGLIQNHDKWSLLSLNAHSWADAAKQKREISKYVDLQKKAISYIENSSSEAKDLVIVTTYIELGKTYHEQKQYNEAVKAYDKAYPYYKKANNRPLLLPEYMGDSYFALNDYDKAYNSYAEALENIERESSSIKGSSNEIDVKREYEIIKNKLLKTEEQFEKTGKEANENFDSQVKDERVKEPNESGVNSNVTPDIKSNAEPNTNPNAELNVDFGPYMRELQRRIKMNWDPPKGNESKRVVLLFSIAKDGRLLGVKVHKSSGLQAADKAAIRAVEMTAPFKPLPTEYKRNSVDIQFTFDYNAFGIPGY